MRFYLFVSLVLLNINAICQTDFATQYKLIKSNIQIPFETLRRHTNSSYAHRFERDTFFIDYIVHKYTGPRLKQYISNRYFLKQFSTIARNKSEVKLLLLESNRIEINIKNETKSLNQLGKIQYDSTNFKKRKSMDYDFKYIKTINYKKIFGLRFDTISVTQISAISIKINDKVYHITNNLFNDIFFPNLSEAAYAAKPVEAFLSPNQKYIYLYFFGGQESSKYFCKIIFDIRKRRVIGRMIADSEELNAYQCTYPENFIGF